MLLTDIVFELIRTILTTMVPARAEIAIRRVKWWQATTEQNHAHLQTMAAIWGQLRDEAQTLTAEGFSAPAANLFAVAFSEDLHLFAGLPGTEDFFEFSVAKHFGVVSIICDEDFRDPFQRAYYFKFSEQQHSPIKDSGTH